MYTQIHTPMPPFYKAVGGGGGHGTLSLEFFYMLQYFEKILPSVDNNDNNELYLHDHTNTYSIAKVMFRN